MSSVLATKDELRKFRDEIMEKLDKFVGEIETRRTEQKLYSGQHREINDRLDKIDKHLGISTAS